MDPMTKRRDTLEVVSAIILEVMDEDESEYSITLHTSFQDDLELESIEMVALGDLLQAHYGAHLNFAGWLTQLSFEELMDLKVGELVAWIDQSISSQT